GGTLAIAPYFPMIGNNLDNDVTDKRSFSQRVGKKCSKREDNRIHVYFVNLHDPFLSNQLQLHYYKE
ncbi:hypothetical protein C6A37_12315, partial [Desulfobacteraceae bacterium SEEP-SAG9]